MKTSQILVLTGAFLSTTANATNGYMPHGIGIAGKGMGGISIAYQADSVAVGGNPAGSAFMQNRFDAGIDVFKPDRGASIVQNAALQVDMDFDGNDTSAFLIPEIGYRRGINDTAAFGLSVFGHGGMNTDYKTGIPLLNGGTAESTGVNLMQLFVVPSVSYKINQKHSVGIGLNLIAQGFKAEGLNSFDNPMSTASPGNVTNNGTDWAYGGGIRLGWIGQLSPQWTLGATYQTRSHMGEFDSYSGLFAEQGGFDIPSNLGVGAAFSPNDKLVLAADLVRINYSEVNSIANSGQVQAQLGSDNGPGFGWEDITVFKLGASYAVNPKLTLRAGFNHGDAPIGNSQTLFNIIAPATIEDHVTLGASWSINPASSITVSYMHALSNDINGQGSIVQPFGGGEANLTMKQNAIGVAFNWVLDN
ncbi:MAG: outer membrane protein transport protein [Granulosicoccaceae bacterium]